MGVPDSTRLMRGLLCVAVLSLMVAATASAQPRVGRDDGWQVSRGEAAYEAGYREGIRRGEQDGRRGREFEPQGERPFNRRDEFRRGYADGYRAGYERVRSRAVRQFGVGVGRRAPGGYQEAAAARGYSDGFEDGLNDGRNGNRYDPVDSRDYRDGDNGYARSYGSRDAYRNNYRAGFRQGYEEGYRDGARRR
jgi:flagellar biosynthesis/type III secretory pathway protein FliH